MVAARRRTDAVLAHLFPHGTVAQEDVKFVSLEEAAKMDGVRVTFSVGVPALFTEMLKNMLDVKGVLYTRVMHPPMGKGDNQELLYKLTAQRSLPTMLCDNEPPRSSWVEQVVKADKLGGGPSLIPVDPKQRILMFGLMHELLAEDGMVWRKRLTFGKNPLTLKYGFSEEAIAAAPQALVVSLTIFKEQLEKQKAAGSSYLIGESLTALDVYFATAATIFDVPGPDIMPRTKQNAGLLQLFAVNPPEVQALLDSTTWLRDYRDYIYKTHLVTPALLGGIPA